MKLTKAINSANLKRPGIMFLALALVVFSNALWYAGYCSPGRSFIARVGECSVYVACSSGFAIIPDHNVLFFGGWAQEKRIRFMPTIEVNNQIHVVQFNIPLWPSPLIYVMIVAISRCMTLHKEKKLLRRNYECVVCRYPRVRTSSLCPECGTAYPVTDPRINP